MTLADLQSNISISATNAVTGDIEWCSGYTQFSTDIGEQAGWYLALQVTPDIEDATVTAAYNGTIRELDNNIFIIRLADGEDTITFTANKEGYTEGRLTLDISGLDKELINNYCYVRSLTNGITVTPLQFGESKDLSGVVPYDTTTSSNKFRLSFRTFNLIPAGSEISVAHQGTLLGSGTFYVYTPQEGDGEPYSAAEIDITLTQAILDSESPTLSTTISPLDGAVTDRFYCSLNVDNVTLQAPPQTLTISIPENNEQVAKVQGQEVYTTASSFFAASENQKVTTITNVSSDGRTMSIGATSGSDDGSRRLFPMNSLVPSLPGTNDSMSGVTIPIKVTRLDSTYIVKFRKGNSDHANRAVTFNNDNVGYILTGPSWNNDWPFYIDVYNSSDELIDTYTINCLGYAQSYDWTASAISDFARNGSYYTSMVNALPADTDIVPDIEDANGNSVTVATFHENLVLPPNAASQSNIAFSSGTLHYVQGLKYTSTQEALPDGYYLILKIPAYSGTQGSQVRRIRSQQYYDNTYRQYTDFPIATDVILKPIAWQPGTMGRTIEKVAEPWFYTLNPGVNYNSLYYQTNLTIDPIPPTLTELTSYDVNNVQFTKAQLYGNEGRMIVHGEGTPASPYSVQIDGISFKAVSNPDYPDDTTPYFGAFNVNLPITYTYSGGPVEFDILTGASVASAYSSYLTITEVDTTNNIVYFKLKKNPSNLDSQKYISVSIKASSNNYSNNFKVYFTNATIAT